MMAGKKERKKLFLLLNAAAALLLGVLIYLYFRPDTYISKFLFNLSGPGTPNAVICEKMPQWLVLFFRNFSCDILWAYALTITLCLVMGTEGKNGIKIFLICGAFEIATECLQKTGVITGTFDFWDMALEVVTSALVTLTITKK